MKVTFSLRTNVQFSAPVSGHVFRLRATPTSLGTQRLIDSELTVTPEATIATVREPLFGNTVTTGRIEAQHSSFAFTSVGAVEVQAANNDMQVPLPYLLFPTKLTSPGPALLKAASDWSASIKYLPATQKALWLMQAIHEHFTYSPGLTATTTTAESAFCSHNGVCQDYTQAYIALARLAGLPARYCAGLMLGEGQTHAWAEVWSAERWLGVDPTHNRIANEHYVILSRGLDFESAAIERGIFYGSCINGITQNIHTVAHVGYL